jgi:hypothetical protein
VALVTAGHELHAGGIAAVASAVWGGTHPSSQSTGAPQQHGGSMATRFEMNNLNKFQSNQTVQVCLIIKFEFNQTVQLCHLFQR